MELQSRVMGGNVGTGVAGRTTQPIIRDTCGQLAAESLKLNCVSDTGWLPVALPKKKKDDDE